MLVRVQMINGRFWPYHLQMIAKKVKPNVSRVSSYYFALNQWSKVHMLT